MVDYKKYMSFSNNEIREERDDIRNLAKKIKEGKVILFLGAAIHCQPPSEHPEWYPKEVSPPLGRELANILEKEFPDTFGRYPDSVHDIKEFYKARNWTKPEIDELFDLLLNRYPKALEGDESCMEKITAYYQAKCEEAKNKIDNSELTDEEKQNQKLEEDKIFLMKAKELSDLLAQEMLDTFHYSPHTLSWIAQYYELKRSRRQLVEKLKVILNDKQPSPLLQMLAEMNFRYVITTNYDNLFEDAITGPAETNAEEGNQQAIQQTKKIIKGIYKPERNLQEELLSTPALVTPDGAIAMEHTTAEKRKEYTPRETTTDKAWDSIKENEIFVYKIHGDIGEIFKTGRYEPDDDALVITDEDYIQFILRMGEKYSLNEKNNFNPIPASFAKALATPEEDVTVLFIGYSLMDYNLRLLFKSAMWKKNIKAQLRKWSIDLTPDDTIRQIYSTTYTLTFIQKNAWAVIPFLYDCYFKPQKDV